ncbi:hypothetical protein BTO06_12455 [Tenacibaculum sp. SZ-18]|nr:hypothetical protein BTO06_12455 [Tenacibaculum sp. SZ-18]
MGMFASILSFFGCKEKQSEKSKSDSEFDAQISESIEAFKNRPIHENLTQEIIDSTKDEDLVQVIFDNLISKLPEDYTKEYETVNGWNQARKTIYLIWLLEAEVNNGGFNQFYFNSSGQFYKYIPEALLKINAELFADLTERANKVYESENEKITEKQDGTLEGFSESYENNPLNSFDDEFYELYDKEDLMKLQVEYIRENSKEFID